VHVTLQAGSVICEPACCWCGRVLCCVVCSWAVSPVTQSAVQHRCGARTTSGAHPAVTQLSRCMCTPLSSHVCIVLVELFGRCALRAGKFSGLPERVLGREAISGLFWSRRVWFGVVSVAHLFGWRAPALI
jgi:hypothetical protein